MPPSKFQILIDRTHYEVDQEQMTGSEIRQVPDPPISEERDLYQVRPGDTDLLIDDGDVVEIHNGLRFFSAPRNINPGS